MTINTFMNTLIQQFLAVLENERMPTPSKRVLQNLLSLEVNLCKEMFLNLQHTSTLLKHVFVTFLPTHWMHVNSLLFVSVWDNGISRCHENIRHCISSQKALSYALEIQDVTWNKVWWARWMAYNTNVFRRQRKPYSHTCRQRRCHESKTFMYCTIFKHIALAGN